MKVQRALVVSLLFLALSAIPAESLAVQITVDVNGQQVVGNDSVCLNNSDGTPKQYPGGVTITYRSAASGCPRVEVYDDASIDHFRMKNIRFTLTAGTPSVTNYPITFWADLATKPDPTPPGAPVAYKWTAVGSFVGTASTTIKGWVKNDQGTWTCIFTSPQVCGKMSGPSPFNLSQQSPSINILAPRGVKGDMLITLSGAGPSLGISNFPIENTGVGECTPEEKKKRAKVKGKKPCEPDDESNNPQEGRGQRSH